MSQGLISPFRYHSLECFNQKRTGTVDKYGTGALSSVHQDYPYHLFQTQTQYIRGMKRLGLSYRKGKARVKAQLYNSLMV